MLEASTIDQDSSDFLAHQFEAGGCCHVVIAIACITEMLRFYFDKNLSTRAELELKEQNTNGNTM